MATIRPEPTISDDAIPPPSGNLTWSSAQVRLDQRAHPKWDSMSWVALRPLISSVNQVINSLAPTLVPELRQAWIAATDAAELDPVEAVPNRPGQPGRLQDRIIDRTDASCFLLMGDTGEQDASQYVVAPGLEAALAEHEPAFLLICSDVIYPSGDLNDYVDGFYLPYEHLLREGREEGRWGGRPAAQRVYGLAGNHDWYDGLTGFMSAFCGVDRLPATSYGWPAAGTPHQLVEGIGRMFWRRPSPGRAEPLKVGAEPTTPDQLRAELMPPAIDGTRQPGPYYAIQLDGVLLVCIDGGIGTGPGATLDAQQGRWLADISKRPGPKVLLTGYPLLVNAGWKPCPIDAPTSAGLPASVQAVVADPANRYVAAMGGDTHNFQHYEIEVQGRPLTYLVSGGGGAYLSASHPVRVFAARQQAAGLAPADQAPIPTVRGTGGTPDRPGMMPEDDDSLAMFTELMLPRVWRFMRFLTWFAVGIGLGALTARAGGPGRVEGDGRSFELLGLILICAGLAVVRAFGVRLRHDILDAPPEKRWKRTAYRFCTLVFAACAGAAVPLAGWFAGAEQWAAYLGTWALITVSAGLIALMRRRTGWWRPPAEEAHGDKVLSTLLFGVPPLLAVLAGLLAITVGTAHGDSMNWRLTWRLGAVVGGAALLVIAAAVGWVLRSRLPNWRRISPKVSISAQVLTGALVLAGAPAPGAAWQPLGVVLGVVLSVIVAAAALAVTLLTVFLMALPRLGRTTTVRQRWGVHGHLALPVLGTAATVLLALLVEAADHLSGPVGALGLDGWRGTARTAVITAVGVAVTVFSTLGIDSLRRHSRRYYKPLTTLLGLVFAAVLWRADAFWLCGGLVGLGVGTMLAAFTVAVAYLAFLGGHNLVLDRDAHVESEIRPSGQALLTRAEAAQVIEWRITGRSDDVPVRVQRRAKMVFPSTDKPEGWVQRKASEFFSSDRPPFFQHFLVAKIRVDEAGRVLELIPHLVTGESDGATIPQQPIRIPLPQ